jgi:hypothetical protein
MAVTELSRKLNRPLLDWLVQTVHCGKLGEMRYLYQIEYDEHGEWTPEFKALIERYHPQPDPSRSSPAETSR